MASDEPWEGPDRFLPDDTPMYPPGASTASPRYCRAVWTSWTPSSTAEFSRLEVSDNGWTWREATKDEEKALGHIGKGVFEQ